jgi:PAS domain S-box-containing protein
MTQSERMGESARSQRLSESEYRLVFEGAPGLYLVLRPDLTIVAASDAYLRTTGTQRAAILGRPLLEVFPSELDDGSGTGLRNLRVSLERVLRTRQPDGVTIQKQGGQERHWSLVNSPVLDDAGDIAYIIHRIEDVSSIEHLKRAGLEHSRMTRRLGLRLRALEAEIDRRAQLLQEANDQLRAASQAPGEGQRADLLGLLTGAVAHDFNDLMTIIAGSLCAVEDVADPRGELRHLASTVQRAIERGARLTSQLLAVGRSHVTASERVELNDLLRDFHLPQEPAAADEPAGMAGAAAAAVAKTHPRDASGKRRRARILVVEDDPDVLDAVLVTVSTLGYGTMAAHDGQEALATLGGPEPLDLLFTDVVMPRGINGIQLARRARELRPDLRILLTSGYGFQALAEGENDFPLLQKPYQRQALADTLRYVLDS